MKVEFTKDWCMNMAKHEGAAGDPDCSAGCNGCDNCTDDMAPERGMDAAEIAELKEAYALLFKDNALLRQVHTDFRRECGDTDAILRVLGLDPVNCRTDGGSLKLVMLLGAIEHRDVMLRREARQVIKGLTVQADADGVWLNFAASTGLHALLNVERIADSHGGIVSKALRDWAADVGKPRGA